MKSPLMVNGAMGNMAIRVISECVKRGYEVIPFSLTGSDNPIDCKIGKVRFTLIRPWEKEKFISNILDEYPKLIAVDYTHPSAVNENIAFYAKHGIPSVVGTTGVDREALVNIMKDAKAPFVVAPNMAKQIVAFQAAMKWMAETFPGAFRDFALRIVESHQSGKADTSGTAKALLSNFCDMGAVPGKFAIERVRERDSQLAMGVPAEHIDGHGFHTYTVNSPDSSVFFKFTHNVCGREPYVHGTIDAIKFLFLKMRAGESGLYNMIDVLKAG
jgi:4-hydroxy-tetrahydrodipicolinate reductase